MKLFTRLTAAVVVLLLFTACKTNEQVIYLQNAGNPMPVPADGMQATTPEPVIKAGDLLIITVNTPTPEASMPFNLPLVPTAVMNQYNMSQQSIANYAGGLQNYIVTARGTIEFPVIGELKVEGMTKSQLAERIKSLIHPRYTTEEPIIMIRFGNFRVSVLGEVTRPGSYPVDNEKISILEAISMAGDLTIYGMRENVLLIRETKSGRETIRIDLRDKDLLRSPYYFLQQGDMLYVQPNSPRTRSAALGTAETLSISIVGTLISLTSLIVNFVK
jgi:polysaccharide export outer membrane protein